ncbi:MULTISPECIES: DUF397 domain-containing protein [Actinoalloteichus]|uniref:DUF397 domain-containing protein n=1 Tax=Actinoalloteichus caeruleus DSM 43889 TaxID=1120930 RepID=A0ABT1JLS1_ACTCY|nr:DUF397 domain-containing protein [Actinoalloteichus caeruleus]MCP2333119.1 protein of unknown function (DUF397) [Actinoalloteichus caeruleus DSM 43889]
MDVVLANWRKSTRSSGNDGGCVEIGGAPGLVGIRDTKNRAGGTLVVSRHTFSSFLTAVKAGRL